MMASDRSHLCHLLNLNHRILWDLTVTIYKKYLLCAWRSGLMIEHVFSLIVRTVQVGGKTDFLMVLTKHILVAECEKMR